jgi:dCMP deaminase
VTSVLEREFDGPLFLGAGKHSLERSRLLKQKLDLALNFLGGLQQPDHPESGEEAAAAERDRALHEESLAALRTDIFVALGGWDPTPKGPLRRPSFESIFMNLAFALAERSTCARLQVGCVITSTDWRNVFGVGYNGGAAGQENDCESPEPGKCGHLHAEDNAITHSHAPFGAEKFVISKNLPCPMCCKRIVNYRGVKRVYYAEGYRADGGRIILQRAEIEVVRLRAVLTRGADGRETRSFVPSDGGLGP